MRVSLVALAAAVMLASFGAPATELATSRLIIKLRPATGVAAGDRAQALSGQPARQLDRMQALTSRHGLGLRISRDLGNRMTAVQFGTILRGASLESALASLRADPAVEFAEIDRRRFARAMPSDPLFPGQWFLRGFETAATNFEAAWDVTTGASDTVIAILDTGVRFEHPDLGREGLGGRLLPGYDFVDEDSPSSFVSANDGDGWDADPSDPGDWVSPAEADSGPLAGCPENRSSWHGTRVASLVGSITNNGTGLAGGTWNNRILPVRVLGKCGGFDSDIIAAMRWSAGLTVAGAPANPAPAQILNLSLGSADSCSSAYRDVITELTAARVVVVVSAGNDSGPVETPANCSGVVAVGGLRHVGTKVGYSSVGPEVTVSAPAGNCPEVDTTFLCSYSLLAADNTGLTVPGDSSYTDDANYNIGTSFSAPIVAGVAGLMHGVNSGLSTAEMIARIRSSARSFPAADPDLPTCPGLDAATGQCNCTTSTCGAGIADAPRAVAEALRPMARIVAPAGSGAGTNLNLDGSTSGAARGRSIVSFAWTVVSGTAAFAGGTTDSTAVVAVPSTGLSTVRLAVTDDTGRSDVQEVTVGRASGGGGGGGAVHPSLLLLLAGVAWERRRRHR